METQYFKDLSNAEYHASHAISSSALVHALRSMAHFWHHYVGNPHHQPLEQTDAMTFGTAMHTFLLEGSRFDASYIVAPKADRRTKAGKEAWAQLEWRASVEKKSLISEEDYSRIINMAAALQQFEIEDEAGRAIAMADVFKKGTAEESFFWKDPDSGLDCRCRTDWRLADIIVDYKTARDARTGAFRNEIARRGYYMRAAMYMDGVEAVTGERPSHLYFIAQETELPHCAATFEVDREGIENGRAHYKQCLLQIRECMEKQKWTGYPSRVQMVNVPSFAFEHVNQ